MGKNIPAKIDVVNLGRHKCGHDLELLFRQFQYDVTKLLCGLDTNQCHSDLWLVKNWYCLVIFTIQLDIVCSLHFFIGTLILTLILHSYYGAWWNYTTCATAAGAFNGAGYRGLWWLYHSWHGLVLYECGTTPYSISCSNPLSPWLAWLWIGPPTLHFECLAGPNNMATPAALLLGNISIMVWKGLTVSWPFSYRERSWHSSHPVYPIRLSIFRIVWFTVFQIRLTFLFCSKFRFLVWCY